MPFEEQAKLDPEEEVLRDAAPDQFKVRVLVEVWVGWRVLDAALKFKYQF